MKTKKKVPLSIHARHELALKVFDAVFAETNSFREDAVGADLAYLLGAILDHRTETSGFVDWSPAIYGYKAPVVEGILRKAFPENSPLWGFIVVENDEG